MPNFIVIIVYVHASASYDARTSAGSVKTKLSSHVYTAKPLI